MANKDQKNKEAKKNKPKLTPKQKKERKVRKASAKKESGGLMTPSS